MIVHLIVVLIIIGILMYLVNSVIPMVAWMKTVINCIVIIAVLLYVLQVFGIYHSGIVIR